MTIINHKNKNSDSNKDYTTVTRTSKVVDPLEQIDIDIEKAREARKKNIQDIHNDIKKEFSKEKINNFTPLDKDTIKDLPKPTIGERILFNISYYTTEYFWEFLSIILIIWLWIFVYINSPFNSNNSINNIASLQQAIDEEKQNQINIAQTDLTWLYIEREDILTQLNIISNNITLREKCIEMNKTNPMPVSCVDLDIPVKELLEWKVNSNWFSQEYKHLYSVWTEWRVQELLSMYPTVADTYPIWVEMEDKYKIKKELAIAIAKADSSLWNELKTTNNIGNVGNNDRWDTVHYQDIKDWIEAIFITLNNKYLKDIYNIWYLSEWWRKVLDWPSCKEPWVFCYATSEENWNINVINTLRLLYNDSSIDETFQFRLP